MDNAALGRALILVALGLASSAAVVAMVAGRIRSMSGFQWARRLAYGFCVALVAANGVMEYALVTNDFSVSYVAQVGSRATPLHIKIVSLWSSLEGSILFWGLILAIYVALFVRSLRHRHGEYGPYALGAAMLVSTFFAFLIAGPANPFLNTPPPIPADGPGPNPLLQNHALMIVHPPMLYLGYVGMTIPFSMGIASLIVGRVGTSWTAAIRRWMLVPWGFLTAGIVLGGWWAYEVLGWGGYWAWDPVENASLLPWLSATAFLHAAMLQERRGLLKAWTLVLLLVTFALTILGTFMTRSGVFNSVHSFTQSSIGPTFLVFLGIVLACSIVLLALRVHLLERGRPIKSPLSREAAFVLNNLLFVILTFSVLVGTTFPLLAEAVRGVKVSVGEPFFNQFALPLGIAIVFLMGVGPSLPWGRPSSRDIRRGLALPTALGLLITAIAFILGVRRFWPAAAVAVSSMAIMVSLRDMALPMAARRRQDGGSLLGAAAGAFVRGRRRYGGQIVHIGVALAVLAIGLSGGYKKSAEAVIDRGQSMTVGDYTLRFLGASVTHEPHRRRTVAKVAVIENGRQTAVLEPAMNHYPTQMNPIGSPAVRSGPDEDLYLSVMQVDPAGAFVGLRVYVNPAVAWLWVALFVMLFGCTIAVWPTRLARRREPSLAAAPAATPASKAT